MPHPQPITQSIHHHRLPAREKKFALSSEVAAQRSPQPSPCTCVRRVSSLPREL